MGVIWISGIATASVTSILSAFIGRGLLAGSDIRQNYATYSDLTDMKFAGCHGGAFQRKSWTECTTEKRGRGVGFATKRGARLERAMGRLRAFGHFGSGRFTSLKDGSWEEFHWIICRRQTSQ
jgi:hypothetical protein